MTDFTYIKDDKLRQKVDEFDKIVAEMRETLIRKNSDYGNENIGTLGEKGIFVRIFDKVCRLKNLVWNSKEAQVKGETTLDTYMDLANYAIIAIIFNRGKWQ